MGRRGDSIKPSRTDTYEESKGVASPLGGMVVETPQGACMIVDASGITCCEICGGGLGDRVGLMLYDPAHLPGLEVGSGFMVQLDPTQARSIAASLLRCAAALDTQKPN